jgi:cyclophilin family peptidyl-prolyl cis-trans isomerase/HEAT repeat protein
MRLRFPTSKVSLPLVPALLASLVLLALGAGCTWDSPEREASFRALARWEDQRLAPQDSLAAMLGSDDAHVRLAAARCAGLIGRGNVLPEMVDLLDDRSLTVAAQAAFSLGLMGDDLAVDELTTAARGPDASVRVAALRGLAHLRHDGQAFLDAAASPDREEAEAAWDGLRNVAAEADSAALHETLLAGLSRTDTDILWRVLRCAELTPWAGLLPAVAPHVKSAHPQVRVHAYRALGRFGSPQALQAVIDGGREEGMFRDRHRSRVDVALMRALGRLGHHDFKTGDDQGSEARDFLVTNLVKGAGSADGHVALAALAAMERSVTDLPLPPEAARQESLLPVWRIRLARAARSHLDHPVVQVRAAAVRAWAQLRGSGAGPQVEQMLTDGPPAQVAVAAVHAISRVHPMPLRGLSPLAGPESQASPAIKAAALEGLVHVFQERPAALPQDISAAYVLDTLTAAAAHDDFVVAATGADLLGRYPSRQAVIALAELWDRAAGPAKADLQLAVMGSLQAMGPAVQALERADSTSYGVDHLMEITRDILREAFDSPDLRIRNRGREAAVATGLLPERLIPSRASLLATLPALKRAPGQAPLALPFKAPEVRCTTEKGEFIIRLDGKLAPNTCATFLDLIGQGFYDNLTFHRVVPDFVVQGGCPRGDGWGGPGFTIRSEWSRALYRRAAVGIAHSGKDSGGSQFFITLSEQPHLNGRYTIFGEVTRGMDVIDRITAGDTFRLEVMP